MSGWAGSSKTKIENERKMMKTILTTIALALFAVASLNAAGTTCSDCCKDKSCDTCCKGKCAECAKCNK
jgi:hypothetical protein